MYGSKLEEYSLQFDFETSYEEFKKYSSSDAWGNFMANEWGTQWRAKYTFGPFTAERDPHSKKNRWRVMNGMNSRIFRGSCGACKRKAERLNTQYAEWLMVKP